MWPHFWFCVGLVKGPLEIMGGNYGDYDTVRWWSIVPKASHCLAPTDPHCSVLIFPFRLFSIIWMRFTRPKKKLQILSNNQYDHNQFILAAKGTWCELDMCPYVKRPPRRALWFVLKSSPAFWSVGDVQEKRGLEPELAKNLLLTTNTINSDLKTVSLQHSSV